jgi:hypothetical protein
MAIRQAKDEEVLPSLPGEIKSKGDEMPLLSPKGRELAASRRYHRLLHDSPPLSSQDILLIV